MSTTAKLKQVSVKQSVSEATSRYKNVWLQNALMNRNPLVEDIYLRIRNSKSPAVFPSHVENIVVGVVKYYIYACMPVTRYDLFNLAVHILRIFFKKESKDLRFKNGSLSVQRAGRLLSCNKELFTRSIMGAEEKYLLVTSFAIIGKYLARVKAAITWYNITNARHFLKVDDDGCAFCSMVLKSLQKQISLK